MDQLEQVLSLATSILNTMNFAAATESTPAGQCRLTACPLLILDSSKLYDYMVKLLFRMHNLMDSEILGGHRSRFMLNHKKLKKFYDRSKVIAYIRSQIEIPSIPDEPPDFLATAEFQGTQVADEVVVKQVEDDNISLISIDDILDMDRETSSTPKTVSNPVQSSSSDSNVSKVLKIYLFIQ